ncbi:MAG: tautomerase family protein [Candidatus Delongbacteria bacterium]|nr:tautomerase family protein [Candidatus Delongbacteria bacterium]
MPLITVESGKLSPEVKRKLIQRLTDIAAETTGIPKNSFWGFIRELSDENSAIGGKPLDVIRKEQILH